MTATTTTNDSRAGTRDAGELLGELHADLSQRLARWLRRQDPKWLPLTALGKRIDPEDAEARADLELVPEGGKPLRGKARAKRGHELLLAELTDRLQQDGVCELRKRGGVAEVRLVEARAGEGDAGSEADAFPAADAPQEPVAAPTEGENCAASTEGQDVASPAEGKDSENTSVPPPTPDAPVAQPPAPSETTNIVRLPVRDLRPHPAALKVPEMREEEWKPFLESVRTSGVQDPLTVQKGGRVLDGRHRLRAAKESAQETVPARVVDLGPDEQTALVYRTALLRRHLGDDQRAMLAARWAEAESKKSRSERARKAGLAGGRGREKSPAGPGDAAAPKTAGDPNGQTKTVRARTRAATQYRVPERKVRAAIDLEKASPDLAAKVLAGGMTLNQARRALTKDRKPEAGRARGPNAKGSNGKVPAPASGVHAKTPAADQGEATPDNQATTPKTLTLTLPVTPQVLAETLLARLEPQDAIDLLRQALAAVEQA
jgi:ParB-like chromosome segregation protein Spo0J